MTMMARDYIRVGDEALNVARSRIGEISTQPQAALDAMLCCLDTGEVQLTGDTLSVACYVARRRRPTRANGLFLLSLRRKLLVGETDGLRTGSRVCNWADTNNVDVTRAALIYGWADRHGFDSTPRTWLWGGVQAEQARERNLLAMAEMLDAQLLVGGEATQVPARTPDTAYVDTSMVSAVEVVNEIAELAVPVMAPDRHEVFLSDARRAELQAATRDRLANAHRRSQERRAEEAAAAAMVAAEEAARHRSHRWELEMHEPDAPDVPSPDSADTSIDGRFAGLEFD